MDINNNIMKAYLLKCFSEFSPYCTDNSVNFKIDVDGAIVQIQLLVYDNMLLKGVFLNVLPEFRGIDVLYKERVAVFITKINAEYIVPGSIKFALHNNSNFYYNAYFRCETALPSKSIFISFIEMALSYLFAAKDCTDRIQTGADPYIEADRFGAMLIAKE